MILPNQFRAGMVIRYEDQLYSILEFQHIKPGKGGAFVRTKLKNLSTGAIVEKTLRPEEKVEEIFVEEKKMRYLYCDGRYHFIDEQTLEEVELSGEQLKDIKDLLLEGSLVSISFHNKQVLQIRLPNFVELQVTETEPSAKGDTAQRSYKKAKVETGAVIQVPLFIKKGDKIKIDTRDKTYVSRV
ncbi:MAG: elongation factor P [Candidatus Omnitrophota bacterium]|nr:MAG: elongation factor P [Candidatus Omnitrophota bacterium]